MKNIHELFDFDEAKLDEQFEQFERSAHLVADQPAARTYASLRALYGPANKREDQALERVYQRLATRASAHSAQLHEPVLSLMPIRDHGTRPLRLPRDRRRVKIWLSACAAVLILGLLFSGFLSLLVSRSQSTPAPTAARVLHKTGPWHIVPTPPSLPEQTNSVNAITVLSDRDAWAVGSIIQNNTPARSLILHWDGSTWKEVPGSATTLGALAAVVALGPNDVWAVGHTPLYNAALIEHWNGQQWSVIPDSHPGYFNAIAALAPNDVWAVGGYMDQNDYVIHSLVEHWNGQQWSVVSTPAVGLRQELLSVTAFSTTDIWVVGKFYLDMSSDLIALIEHWDGHTWQVVASPVPGPPNVLTDISAISPTDIWAVGSFGGNVVNYKGNGAYESQPLVEHWDGERWMIINTPTPPSNIDSGLMTVVALAPNDIWAAGYQTGPVLFHWNGKQWQIVPSASLPKGTEGQVQFLSLAPDPSAPGVLWMAGAFVPPSDSPLIETNML